MDPRLFPIAAGAAAHLVELHLAEGQVVQHHVAHAGDVDALAEGRGGHQHLQAAFAEQRFHALALGSGKPGVVEADKGSDVRLLLAQLAREGDGLHARVHVDKRFLALGNQVHQVALALLQVALVHHFQVAALEGVFHHAVGGDVERFADIGRHLGACRGGYRQHLGVAQLRGRFAQARVQGAEARLRGAHMMRLVHHHEADAAGTGELFGMEGKVLRRSEHDVHLAFCQSVHDALAVGGIGGAGYHLAAHAERSQGAIQVEGLVGHQGAQGVHEQAGLVLR